MSANHYLDSCVAPNISYILTNLSRQPTNPHNLTALHPKVRVYTVPTAGPLLGFQAQSSDVDVSGSDQRDLDMPARRGTESHSSSHMCHFTFTHPLTTYVVPIQMVQPVKYRKPHLETDSHKWHGQGNTGKKRETQNNKANEYIHRKTQTHSF